MFLFFFSKDKVFSTAVYLLYIFEALWLSFGIRLYLLSLIDLDYLILLFTVQVLIICMYALLFFHCLVVWKVERC